MFKKIAVLTIALTLFCCNANAQLLKKLKDKANEKVEATKNKAINKAKDRVTNKEAQADAKVDGAIDGGLDKVEGVFKKKKKDSTATTGNTPTVDTVMITDTDNETNPASDAVNKPVTDKPSKTNISTKYDFKPGNKLIYFNDFSEDELGSFPTNFTSNASGEIIKIDEGSQQWLKLSLTTNALLTTPFNLTKGGTIEFDMYHKNGNASSYAIGFCLFKKSSDADNDLMENERPGTKGITVKFLPGMDNEKTNGFYETYKNGNPKLTNEGIGVPNIQSAIMDENRPGKAYYNHISISRIGTALKVFINTDKIIDLPTAFTATDILDQFKFISIGGVTDNEITKDIFLVSNLKITNELTAVKNMFATNNKIVSTAIQFDAGKAVVKPTSHFALKEIADLLKGGNFKIEIIGHTDNDGTAADNLALSKQRADAVKNYLVTQFGVIASNLTTAGKGSTALIDKGTTPLAKANNRRVEFIKK